MQDLSFSYLMQTFQILETNRQVLKESEVEAYLHKGERITTLQREKKKKTMGVLESISYQTFKKRKAEKREMEYALQCIANKVVKPLLLKAMEEGEIPSCEKEMQKFFHPEILHLLKTEAVSEASEEQRIIRAICEKEPKEMQKGLKVFWQDEEFITAAFVKIRKSYDGRKVKLRYGSQKQYLVRDFFRFLAKIILLSQIVFYLQDIPEKEKDENRVFAYLKQNSTGFGELLLEGSYKDFLSKGYLNLDNSIIVNIFSLILTESYKDVQAEKFLKDLQSRAPVWKTKKNIPEKTVKAMKNSGFNDFFGYVEFDEECELEKMKEIEREFRALNTVFHQKKCEDEALRFRKLGNYKATGLYFPNLHCLCVDIRCPSSMAHEYFHMLDYKNGSLSRKYSFEKCEQLYTKALKKRIENMEDGSALKIQLTGNSKYNADYFLEPTEIFARCGEIYLMRILEISSSLCKVEKREMFAYPDTEELNAEIQKYFDAFFSTQA